MSIETLTKDIVLSERKTPTTVAFMRKLIQWCIDVHAWHVPVRSRMIMLVEWDL